MGGKEPLKTDLSLSESALPKNTVRDDLQIPQDTEGEQGDYHYPQQDVCPFVRTQTALLHIAQGKVKNQRRKERAYAQQRRIIPPRRSYLPPACSVQRRHHQLLPYPERA